MSSRVDNGSSYVNIDNINGQNVLLGYTTTMIKRVQIVCTGFNANKLTEVA